jgi:hypothetical protein
MHIQGLDYMRFLRDRSKQLWGDAEDKKALSGSLQKKEVPSASQDEHEKSNGIGEPI